VGNAVWADARGPQTALVDVVKRIGDGHAASLHKAVARHEG
jgi:thiamine-phosphate pyrophosphorylase